MQYIFFFPVFLSAFFFHFSFPRCNSTLESAIMRLIYRKQFKDHENCQVTIIKTLPKIVILFCTQRNAKYNVRLSLKTEIFMY